MTTGEFDPTSLNNFNSNKYGPTALNSAYYVRSTDTLASHGLVVSFMQVNGGRSLSFKAFITAYNETYNADWASESVYGRTDPIYMFKQNQRRISLGIAVPASTQGEAIENLGRLQTLIQYLYPHYTNLGPGTGGSSATTGINPIPAQTIAASPLMRLKIMNLTTNRMKNGSTEPSYQNLTEIRSKEDAQWYRNIRMITGNHENKPAKGALGVIQSLNINYNLEDSNKAGFLYKDTIIPRVFEINLDFDVIHENTLGWLDDDFSAPTFPYGIHLPSMDPPDPPEREQTVTQRTDPEEEEPEEGEDVDSDAEPEDDPPEEDTDTDGTTGDGQTPETTPEAEAEEEEDTDGDDGEVTRIEPPPDEVTDSAVARADAFWYDPSNPGTSSEPNVQLNIDGEHVEMTFSDAIANGVIPTGHTPTTVTIYDSGVAKITNERGTSPKSLWGSSTDTQDTGNWSTPPAGDWTNWE